MTKGADEPPESPANVVGIHANRVGVELDDVRKRYPSEWIECCRDVMIQYRLYLTHKLETAVGWGRIRNTIMHEFDAYEGDKLVKEDTRLRRQDLEHWVDRGVEISAEKFRFIDYHVRKEWLDLTSDFSVAARLTIAFRETIQHKGFEWLYLGDRRKVAPGVIQEASAYAGDLYTFVPDSKEDEHNQFERSAPTTLYFRSVGDVKFVAIAFYHDRTLTNVKDIVDQSYTYFGYLLPLQIDHGQAGRPAYSMTIYGVLKLFDRSLLLTQDELFQTTSNCFLTGHAGEQKIVLSDVRPATSPYLPLSGSVADQDTRDVLAHARSREFPTPTRQHYTFRRTILTEEAREVLNTLQDGYLLW